MPQARTPHRNALSSRRASSATAAARAPALPHRPLVQALAARLRSNPASPDLPLVVVNRIEPTRSVHILVVWDEWKDLTIPQRGRVIADAFEAAFPAEQSVLRLAMGLTPGEALSQGHLHYQIVPMVRATDKVTDKQARDAMASAGGVLMQVGGDQQLRFATRAQVEEAYRRLVEKINKPIWTLVEEVGSSDAGG